MITIPAICWLMLRRVFNSVGKIIWALSGCLLGSLPFWIFLARGGQKEYASESLIHSISVLNQARENFSYLLSTMAPWMLSGRPLASGNLPTEVTMAVYSTGLVLLVLYAIRPTSELRKASALSWQALLVVLILLCCTGIYIFSFAGSIRGYATRYVLLMYMTVPPAASILFANSKGRWRLLPILGVATVLCMNARSYPFFWSAHRRAPVAVVHASHDELLAYLQRNHIDAVYGPYWDVYYLNFDSKGAIRAVPFDTDFFSVGATVGAKPLRWAVISRSREALRELQRRLGLPGKVLPVSALHWAFVPEATSPEPAEVFLARVRATALIH